MLPAREGQHEVIEDSSWRSPGSRARSVRTCQGLRPRQVIRVLARAHSNMLPSVSSTTSAPGISILSWLNDWPVRSPTDASPAPSRIPAHGSGPMRFATPSSRSTCTTYSLPVSRRTQDDCRAPVSWSRGHEWHCGPECFLRTAFELNNSDPQQRAIPANRALIFPCRAR